MSITDKAERIQTEYAKKLNAIRVDRKLSDEGRRSAIAKAYRTAKADLVAAKATGTDDLQARRRELIARAYGSRLPRSGGGMDVIAFRDAQDRVNNLKRPADARALLARAEESGDTGLATAIARHAETLTEAPIDGQGWAGVLQDYVDARPQLADVFDELRRIDQHLARGHLHNSLAYNLSPPTEISDVAYNETRLRRLAESA